MNVTIAEETKRIAEETMKDSTSMKTIAALTMLFLPGTFVSAVLGMNFFNGEGNTFKVNHLWWVYLVATIPLTLIVLGAWYWWVCRERAKRRAEDEEKRKPFVNVPQDASSPESSSHFTEKVGANRPLNTSNGDMKFHTHSTKSSRPTPPTTLQQNSSSFLGPSPKYPRHMSTQSGGDVGNTALQLESLRRTAQSNAVARPNYYSAPGPMPQQQSYPGPAPVTRPYDAASIEAQRKALESYRAAASGGEPLMSSDPNPEKTKNDDGNSNNSATDLTRVMEMLDPSSSSYMSYDEVVKFIDSSQNITDTDKATLKYYALNTRTATTAVPRRTSHASPASSTSSVLKFAARSASIETASRINRPKNDGRPLSETDLPSGRKE